jgi:lysylphosphatidylglycerol synthetase-like protein (DUF2156 family)
MSALLRVEAQFLGRRADAASFVDHPSGYLALGPRNSVFEMPGTPGFIAYRETGGHLVSFGGVHAPEGDRGTLLDAFAAEARRRRRRVMAIQVREAQVPLFCSRGFTVNQFGTSYSLDLRAFSLGGTSKMQLRNKIKRAERAGLRVAEVGHGVPRNASMFTKLRDVSASWLAKKGKKELDFMIGELGEPDDVERRIFVALDSDDRVRAFITYVPSWGERPGYLHDLTRRCPDVPVGAMELCNSVAMATLRAEGTPFLHFGFTPFMLSGADAPTASRPIRWLVDKLRKYGRFVYPAETQAAYKSKWGAQIREPEYVAVRPLSLRALWDFLVVTRSV